MGRRSGDQQHFQAPAPTRDTQAQKHSKSIGLSARFKDQNPGTKAPRPNRQQRQTEAAHARYPFSGGVAVVSALVAASFVLACIYWISHLSLPQQQE